MKNICFILLAFMLVGCGKGFDIWHPPTMDIHQDFEKYVTQFEQVSGAVGRSVSINDLIVRYDNNLGGPDSSGNITLAYCRTGDGTPKVMVNPKYWSLMSVSDKEELMFHELGHCVLGREHVSNKAAAKDSGSLIPVSVMYPYHLGSRVYGSNYNYYMQELFGNSPSSVLYANAPNQFNGTVYASTMVEEVEVHSSKAQVKWNEETNELDITQMGCGNDEGESHE